MGLFSKAKKAIKAPADFTVGLDRAEPGGDKTVRAPRTGQLVVWFAKDGWRWRLWAPNGKLVAESGEAYIRRYDCTQAAEALAGRAAAARLVVSDK